MEEDNLNHQREQKAVCVVHPLQHLTQLQLTQLILHVQKGTANNKGREKFS